METPSRDAFNCSILQLQAQAQPPKKLSKLNSEDYSPACPPSDVPPKTQRSSSEEKESTNLENTGNHPHTACKPQMPWRKTYLPLPRSDSLPSKSVSKDYHSYFLCSSLSSNKSVFSHLERFQSDPLTQSWSQLFHSSVFMINYLNVLSGPRGCVFSES
ncbi:hypothetical protein CRENBAI_016203 [Crenichthys baileyi]|uniref:Uncharacterized protein n=1 Tax=Crenichthys baileyi TaxID=28760 RepID=A0AAV9SIH5_9TELE